jgi:hypothetical protein
VYDITILIPPKFLPALLGAAPPDFKSKAWKPVVKYYKHDDGGKEYNMFEEEFMFRFEHYLLMENIDVTLNPNMTKETKEVEYLIEIYGGKSILDPKVEISKILKFKKFVFRVYHNLRAGEVIKLGGSKRILQFTNGGIFSEQLNSMNINFVKIDDKYKLFFKVLFTSTITRFFRLFYFLVEDNEVSISTWVRVIYAYEFNELDFGLPLWQFIKFTFKEDPCFGEMYDIFKVFQIIDNLGWRFPLEFQRDVQVYASQADKMRQIIE